MCHLRSAIHCGVRSTAPLFTPVRLLLCACTQPILTTLAPFTPYGVAINVAGDLAISDVSNNRVLILRKGASTPTVACSGMSLNLPIGLAFDGSAGNLAIADYNNNRVVFCNLGTGSSSTFTGGGQAIVPWGVTYDESGNLAIADYSHNRVVLLSPGVATGSLTTIAGTSGTQGTSGDGGPAANGLLFNPTGLAYDASNGLAIADMVRVFVGFAVGRNRELDRSRGTRPWTAATCNGWAACTRTLCALCDRVCTHANEFGAILSLMCPLTRRETTASSTSSARARRRTHPRPRQRPV